MELSIGLKIMSHRPLQAKVIKVYPPFKIESGLEIQNAVCEHDNQTFMLSAMDKQNIEKLSKCEGMEISITDAIFSRWHQKKDGTQMLKCSLGRFGKFEVV